MTNEKIEKATMKAEMQYESLKDKVHEQYMEIERLKNKLIPETTKVYIKLDDEMQETFEKVEKITLTDYERNGNYIDIEGVLIALRDMQYEYDVMKEQYEDEIKAIKDNVKEYWS